MIPWHLKRVYGKIHVCSMEEAGSNSMTAAMV
jgi:hypothetical protein